MLAAGTWCLVCAAGMAFCVPFGNYQARLLAAMYGECVCDSVAQVSVICRVLALVPHRAAIAEEGNAISLMCR